MGPIFPYVRTFCSKQRRKGEKGEGAHANKTQSDSETAPAAMHTHTHKLHRQKEEGGRIWYSQLSILKTVNNVLQKMKFLKN